MLTHVWVQICFRTWINKIFILADINNDAIRRWVEEAALTIATSNNNNDEDKLHKNNNKSPPGSTISNLPASWLLNLNNKLAEAGGLSLLAGNLRNYQHLKFPEYPAKDIPKSPRINGERVSPFEKTSPDEKSSPSSRESPHIVPDGDKSPVWANWWAGRSPNYGRHPLEAAMPPLLPAPRDDQPLDFSVANKFKPKMTNSQTKTLLNSLQNGHGKKSREGRRLKSGRHRHSPVQSATSSSSTGSEDEGVGPPSSTVESPGPPGPLRGETGEYTNTLLIFSEQ